MRDGIVALRLLSTEWLWHDRPRLIKAKVKAWREGGNACSGPCVNRRLKPVRSVCPNVSANIPLRTASS